MEYGVGTILRHDELEEIVRLLLKPYQIRTLSFKEATREQQNALRCLIVDWLQCTPSERRMIIGWEQMAGFPVMDLSGTLRSESARRIFLPPFSWTSVVREVLLCWGLDEEHQYFQRQIGN